MKFLITIGISVILSVTICYIIFSIEYKKEGYIDMVKLNDQFELKIILQKKLDQDLKKSHQILDNLKLEIQRIYNDSLIIGNQRFVMVKQLQTDIETKTYEFSQREQELTEKYNAQIWQQLNEYIAQYGKEKDIDILFGASGGGTILYGSEKYDLTNECITYVNNKYNGE